MRLSLLAAGTILLIVPAGSAAEPDTVLKGLRDFYTRTARPDGSFTPGVDPEYRGMSDSAYSDLAAVTYAVTLHKTFGWKLPFEEKTVQFLLGRQRESGEFINVAGTVAPSSAEGKTYNTTQALVALRALGVKPKYNPLPIFDEILKQDYKSLPPYTTSFFPLAYLCYGQPIPEKADRGIRALMIQDETGYLNDHIAATFHASHYYHLVGESTPKAEEMVTRILREQKPDGSWMLNLPSRDRHATFDAVFTLHQEGKDSAECRRAIERAVGWALLCRNSDGGFGHFPGSTSDADAVYFQVGALVMAGFLKPVSPLPSEPHLLSWGHLMPVPTQRQGRELWSAKLDGWIGSLAFSPDGRFLIGGSADRTARTWEADTGRETARFEGHTDCVVAVQFSPDGRSVATGSYDRTARIWDAASGRLRHELKSHTGAVLSVAFSPDSQTLATAGIDGTVKLWNVENGQLRTTLHGHRSWVNSLVYSPDGQALLSASSDGTLRLWSTTKHTCERTVPVTNAEVRCVAWSADGRSIAAGIRFGMVKVWDAPSWDERLAFQGHESDVWTLAFTPDSSTLLTGNGDWNRGGLVKLWNAATGKPIDQFQQTGEVLSLAVSPDGKSLAVGGGDKRVRSWRLSK